MKNDENSDGELSHLSVLGWAVLFSCPICNHSCALWERSGDVIFASAATSETADRDDLQPLLRQNLSGDDLCFH